MRSALMLTLLMLPITTSAEEKVLFSKQEAAVSLSSGADSTQETKASLSGKPETKTTDSFRGSPAGFGKVITMSAEAKPEGPLLPGRQVRVVALAGAIAIEGEKIPIVAEGGGHRFLGTAVLSVDTKRIFIEFTKAMNSRGEVFQFRAHALGLDGLVGLRPEKYVSKKSKRLGLEFVGALASSYLESSQSFERPTALVPSSGRPEPSFENATRRAAAEGVRAMVAEKQIFAERDIAYAEGIQFFRIFVSE